MRFFLFNKNSNITQFVNEFELKTRRGSTILFSLEKNLSYAQNFLYWIHNFINSAIQIPYILKRTWSKISHYMSMNCGRYWSQMNQNSCQNWGNTLISSIIPSQNIHFVLDSIWERPRTDYGPGYTIKSKALVYN